MSKFDAELRRSQQMHLTASSKMDEEMSDCGTEVESLLLTSLGIQEKILHSHHLLLGKAHDGLSCICLQL